MFGTKSLRILALGLGSAPFLALAAHASSFTAGNLVVVRMGDGTASLTSASTAVFLDEYTPAGTLVQSIPLPTAATGSTNPLTNSGVATSEGYLNLSNNEQYLVLAGYGVAPGLTSIAGTNSTTAPRVVARVDLNGNIDTSTLLNGDTSYSGNNIRSAISDDGNQFWTAGTALAVADGGVRYIASLGANTSTQLSTTVTNTRVIGSFGGQLYVSTASGSFKGVNTVGTGLPTTSGQTITLLTGFPSVNPSQYDYFFADANTLYVAEDGSSGATAGIEKWTQSAGTWTRQYTLSPSGTGARGLTGVVNAGVVTLYATTTSTSANQIVTVTDTGAGSTFSPVAIAATNEVFRGVRHLAMGAAPGIDLCRPTLATGTPEDGWTCPCSAPPSNQPTTPGAGCNALNSIPNGGGPTGGALMTSSGTASVTNGSDTLKLTVVGLPLFPNESAYLLQGSTQTATPLTFGQGLRCCGGTIKRLQIHSPIPAGTSFWPAPGDFSMEIHQRSATLGDTISSGTTRCYFIQYRATNIEAGCAFPNNFSSSQSQVVLWGP